jgi:hypothetical protein
MTREMNIILNTKEDRQMVETSMLLVIKTELNHLVQVDTGTEMNGIGNIAPGVNETEMIPQVVVATEMTNIMITGKNTEVMMIVEDPGTKKSMIDRKMMQIQRIILVIVIVTKPVTVIIMISTTETELIEKEDFVKWKMSLERDKIIGLQGEIVMVEGIEIEKDKGKSILTDMSIGGLMTTTIGAMMMTHTIGVVKGPVPQADQNMKNIVGEISTDMEPTVILGGKWIHTTMILTTLTTIMKTCVEPIPQHMQSGMPNTIHHTKITIKVPSRMTVVVFILVGVQQMKSCVRIEVWSTQIHLS